MRRRAQTGQSAAAARQKASTRLILIFSNANTDLQHRIIFFLSNRPDHASKFNLVTDDRRGAKQMLDNFTQRLLFITILCAIFQAIYQCHIGIFCAGLENKITEEALV